MPWELPTASKWHFKLACKFSNFSRMGWSGESGGSPHHEMSKVLMTCPEANQFQNSELKSSLVPSSGSPTLSFWLVIQIFTEHLLIKLIKVLLNQPHPQPRRAHFSSLGVQSVGKRRVINCWKQTWLYS